MAVLPTDTSAFNIAHAVTSGPMTSFHWSTEDVSKRLLYIDPKASFRIGLRAAWHPTYEFQIHVWDGFLLPKILNVFNKNLKQIYGSRRKQSDAEIKCYMTGLSSEWKESKPTIVASSTNPKVAQNIISVLRSNPIISRLDCGFDFYADPDPGDIIRSALDSEVYPSDFTSNTHSLCGTRILIAPDLGSGSSEWKHATLGGLLQIDNACYGITAAHVFSCGTATANDSTEGSESEHSDSSRTSSAQTKSPASLHSSSYLASGTTVYIDPAMYARTTDDNGRHKSLQDGDRPKLSAEYVLGELHGAGSQGSWLNASKDWALIKIPNPKFHLPNTVRFNGRTTACSSIATNVPNGQVVVASGFKGIYRTETAGRKRGVLLPGAPEMISLWTIDGSSSLGDCGSWVIDVTSGQVYGMLLASSKQQNCSYCLSMSEIFDSITSTLGVDTPTILNSGEDELGLGGLPRPTTADALASRQSPRALGDTPDQELPCGEQATRSQDKSNTEKPVMEQQVTTTAPETTKEHKKPPIVGEEDTTSTPVAYDPDDGTLLRAIKRGDSCYEIPTTKVDISVARKLGYDVWQGQSSTVLETYGKELVQESRAQRDKMYPPNASYESAAEDDAEGVSVSSASGSGEDVEERTGTARHEQPSGVRNSGLVSQARDEDGFFIDRVDPDKTGQPDPLQIEKATSMVERENRAQLEAAEQYLRHGKVSDKQAAEPTRPERQGVRGRLVNSKHNYLTRSQVLSKSGNDKETGRDSEEIIIRRDGHNDGGDYDRRMVRGSAQEQARDREQIVLRRNYGVIAKDGVEKIPKQNHQLGGRHEDFDDRYGDRSDNIERHDAIGARDQPRPSGAIVLRAREREEFEEMPRRRRRSPLPREEIIIRRDDTNERSYRPRHSYHEDDIIISEKARASRDSQNSMATDRTRDISVTRSEDFPRAATYDQILDPVRVDDTTEVIIQIRHRPDHAAKELNSIQINHSGAMRVEPGTNYRRLEAATPNVLSPEEQRLLHEEDDDRREQYPIRAIPQLPRKGTTKLPKRLIRVKALDALGYDYEEIDNNMILIKHALGRDDIDEVFSLSKGPLSGNAAETGRSVTGDFQHNKANRDLPLPHSAGTQHSLVLQSYRDLLEEYRMAEKRLFFKSQIQQVFLEGELPATSRVERIMKHFDEHLGHIVRDDVVEVLEEEILGESNTPGSEPRYTDFNESRNVNGETRLHNLIDELTKEVHQLRVQNHRANVEGAELPDKPREGANVRNVAFQEPYRPGRPLSPIIETAEEEFHQLIQLEQRYRASAIARGLSTKTISTIINKINYLPDDEGYYSWSWLSRKRQALQNLMEGSSTGTEQKEVSWSNPTTSHAFAGRDESYRSEETASPLKSGILRRQSRHGDRYVDEEIDSSRGPAPVREQRPEREMLREVIVRDEGRERPRSPPAYLREDYGRTTAGPIVIREREREHF
ncbi:hypothetical protein LTR10_021375 [Elasticomyces elasticus]|uniref:DUF8035 domain-containing protein n=1 Tax=Exophiala sideris TaxID=1016849 RepID=A0ABR0JHQ6_9EURO|nr:hypothetical protein LTR10_021375 [Elasticomyces elasticus]KAK5033405.1 hypothetical protein LTS07_003708 [Exophiala sideris]KAK5042100.1 hypothetical protein LTR13_001906 [Exophiala sideris]KAK5063949.1 hypothetical protein LTR69_003716 [Exophiala sideris]KAK5185368.1 hypothetical protein LTR44_002357 [Eurotiomycetes sp. CCFEE 6388]